MTAPPSDHPPPSDGWFGTTRWTVVVSAGESDSPAKGEALETLCRTYWFPLYTYVRRRGHSPADAQDLTQEFFAQLLMHNWIARADRRKGRFRSFLLMALNRFLANEWDRARSQKRGGHIQQVPLPLDLAESRYQREPADASTPEHAYERQWALTLLAEVLERLRSEYEQGGKATLFDQLKPCLVGTRETQPYRELADQLNMSEGAVKVAVSRLRERYRERLKEEIANTVASPDEVNEELRHFVRVLARG